MTVRPLIRGVALAVLSTAVALPLAGGAGGRAARAAEAFVAGLEDLPLMPGLSVVEEAGLIFDAPSGRIVEIFARGSVGRTEALAFYAATLPQLGWTAEGATAYGRERETLRLEFFEEDGELTVRFFLSPD